jgi:hypothetical protein
MYSDDAQVGQLLTGSHFPKRYIYRDIRRLTWLSKAVPVQ